MDNLNSITTINKYTHLSFEERFYIETRLNQGDSITAIAASTHTLGVFSHVDFPYNDTIVRFGISPLEKEFYNYNPAIESAKQLLSSSAHRYILMNPDATTIYSSGWMYTDALGHDNYFFSSTVR